MWLTFHPPSLSTRQGRRFVGTAHWEISCSVAISEIPGAWILLGPSPWVCICRGRMPRRREEGGKGEREKKTEAI